jgi:hypothetical protein
MEPVIVPDSGKPPDTGNAMNIMKQIRKKLFLTTGPPEFLIIRLMDGSMPDPARL